MIDKLYGWNYVIFCPMCNETKNAYYLKGSDGNYYLDKFCEECVQKEKEVNYEGFYE